MIVDVLVSVDHVSIDTDVAVLVRCLNPEKQTAIDCKMFQLRTQRLSVA